MTQLATKAAEIRATVIRGTAIALAAGALTACETTPAYPTHSGYTPPPPIKPGYSAGAEAAPPPASPPAETAPEPVAAAPAAAPAVESQALPPVGAPAPPPNEPTPPAYTPPPEAVAPPPPAYEPPRVRYHPAPERVIADGKVVSAKGMYRDYVVQKGDHVDAIARDLQTTRKELVEANRLKEPSYEVRPGQHLKVPVDKAYVVAPGDTVSAVAKRFGVSPGDLADLNAISERSRLRPGEKLALPANFEDHGPTRLAGAMVAERAPPTVRTRSSYRPRADEEATGGPYVPSPAALAAAAALRNAPPAPAYAPSPTPSPSYTPPQTYTPRSTTSETPTMSRDVAVAGHGRFIWPVRGQILSPFGVMGVGRRNDGLDIGSAQGTVVHAAAAGEVVYAGNQVPGFGNLVLIKHADGWVTAYAHLDATTVHMRESVIQGQEVGLVGSSGGVTGPQLHFEIRYAPSATEKARPIDPMLVLPKQ